MSLQLQMFFIIASLISVIFIIREIRKHKLNIDDSIIWIVWAMFLVIASCFPSLSTYAAKLLGFDSASNLILCFFVFMLYIFLFFQTISISALKQKNKELIQKLSIKETNSRNNNEDKNE